ncbi:hypothetical protein Q4485_04475 [Granulosicoccaceae sp. 1_MG-2023]|nr:hypothetical protein [Granulosicoccaceae sp. 1_MG-2023]
MEQASYRRSAAARAALHGLIRPLALSCLLASSACQPQSSLPSPSDTPVATPAHKAAPAVLPKSNSRTAGGDSFTGLRLISEQHDSLGQRHLRYRQYFRGLALWPGETILHFDSNGQLLGSDGRLVTPADDFTTEATIDAARAAEAALAALGAGWQAGHSELLIATGDSAPRLAWAVAVQRGLKQRTVLIDAGDGALIRIIEETWS